MKSDLKIAVVGDYNPEFKSHPATTAAIQRSAAALHLAVSVQWVPTESISAQGAEAVLEAFDGIWAAPGSPYRSFHGMLQSIRYARERKRPFYGT
jgi:CTP synthase (UTP-ammonia lyase)